MTAVILTPAYSHVHHLAQRAIVRSGLPWLPLYEHSDLVRVRSVLIETALARKDAQRFILIDADTVPEGDAINQLAESLEVTPDRAVWGLYPLREGTRWSVHPETPELALIAIEKRHRFRIISGGLGFCAIHRESLERVAATLPTIRETTGVWRPFCIPIVRQHEDRSEYYADDGSLCLRLRESGTELWCNPTLRAGHAVTTLITDITHG